jgi:carboxylesterase
MDTSQSSLYHPEFDGSSFYLPGSSTGVLLLHGFTATTVEVRGLANYFQTHLGCTVSAPLLPGHGTTPVDLSKTLYTEWIETAESSLEELRQKSQQVIVGGESMGGLLALYLGACHPEILGLLIYAPALIVPDMQKARIFQHFIFSSPKDLKPTKPGFLPWQGYRVNPLRSVVELGKLQNVVRNRLADVHQPVIIFQGMRDETIDILSSKKVLESVPSQIKELVVLDDFGHCILLNAGYEHIYDRSAFFIQSLLASQNERGNP